MNPETQAVLQIVAEAGKLAMHYYQQQVVVEHKSDTHHSDPVSIADREVEQELRKHLRQQFPEDGIIGEEGEDVISRSGRIWLLDPIDGTLPFLARRHHGWAVVACLISGDFVGRTIETRQKFTEEYITELAVIHCPATNEFVFADSSGAYFWDEDITTLPEQPDKLSVDASDKPLSRALLASFMSSKTSEDNFSVSVELIKASMMVFNGAAGATEMLRLVTGNIDAWALPLPNHCCPWDYLPGEFIVRQAGGYLNTVGEWHIVATNQRLLNEISQLVS